ncbi:MAG: hypothetical protein DWI02_03295 [Planctomycetota bacterium]|nr:MAG: hypothetical protein DWI02_03295 [Planctomycetota bacterium]
MFAEGLKRPRGRNLWQQRHPASEKLDSARHAGGEYVYVVDETEAIFVVPDGPHRHPEVLGQGEGALYAGEIKLDPMGRVTELNNLSGTLLNNLSGTFQFHSPAGLDCLFEKLAANGVVIDREVVYFYGPEN